MFVQGPYFRALVAERLGVPAAHQRRRAFQVLKWVGLQHRMNSYPRDLSGGERRRVALKDNVCLAGVPMMIGANFLDGSVPDVDATVVADRLLDLFRCFARLTT